MKKLLFFAAVISAVISVTAADQLIIDDNMAMPMRRTWTMVNKKSSTPWQNEQKITVLGNRLSVRFSHGGKAMEKFELIEAATKRTVLSCNDGKWGMRWPHVTPGEYILRASGKPCSSDTWVVVETHRTPAEKGKTLQYLPTWNNYKACTVESAGKDGINILTSGKLNFISSTYYNRLKPGKNYRIEFEVVTFAEQNVFIRARWGKGANYGNRDFTLKPAEGVRVLTLDFVPTDNRNISINIYCESKLQIRRFRLYIADPPVVRTRKIGNNKAYFEHRNTKKEPANPELTAPVFFRRPPRMIYFDSIPQKHEIVNSIDTFTPPGEYAVWHFGVHNPCGDKKISGISVSDLLCGKNVIPAKDIALNFVEFQDYPMTASNFMNIPERVLPVTIAPDGELNRIFWLQSRIPAAAVPGIYTGKCVVICSGKKISLPLRLRILPFKLKKAPDVYWTMYTNLFHGQKRLYSYAAHKRYLQDMKDYGIESMQVMASSEYRIKYIQDLRREVGMTGPMILAGTIAEITAAKNCGYKVIERISAEKNGKRGYWYEFPDIRAAFVARMKEIDSWIKKHGGPGLNEWYYEGHDEPHLYKDRWNSALWQCKLAKAAGVKTSSCTYPVSALDEIGPYLDISTNMLIGNNAEMEHKLKQVGKKRQISYSYLGAGSYRGQEGGLMPNRLMAGMLLYKLGLKNHISYTYLEPDFPVNHFERGKRYHMAYPVSARPDGKGRVSYFTLQYEGLREGITDYHYLYTLKCAIEDARKAGRTAAADAAEKTMQQLLDAVPYMQSGGAAGNGITAPGNFNNTHADHFRQLVASEIIKLQSGDEK